jgi:class 3 adenylate cyclase
MIEYASGTVAVLFTDIERSTKRWVRDFAAMWAAIERHFALLGEALSARQRELSILRSGAKVN